MFKIPLRKRAGRYTIVFGRVIFSYILMSFLRRDEMKELRESMMDGLKSLPAFPIVLVTVGDNSMVAAAFHFYSYNPPSVMIGIKPDKFTFQLIKDMQEFGINIPSVNQLEEVKLCGSISGKDEDKFKLANLTKQRSNHIELH